ncbi:MAG TPA: C-GCAxxG-C-C family protein [Prolixibacteraceae bacterium]|nr:C-GCAxxG-C-C family protein [Prolixibacteraceae bacterium]
MVSKEEVIDNALIRFNEGYACSQSVLLAFNKYFDLDEKTAKLISSTFGGGMGRLREKCGALTGGFMVIGLAMGNEKPDDMDTKLQAYSLVRELNKKFEEKYETSSCKELLKKYATPQQVDARVHHQLICQQVVVEAVELVYDLLKQEGKF